MNTAEYIVEMLRQAGVRYVFGVPGGALEDFNTAIFQSNIRAIVTKHEEGAAFMADGYARLSGQLGVCCSTAGPGATNLVTGIASAYGDQIPVLALTGQVGTGVFGKGALQESGTEQIDVVNIFRTITKYSAMLINEERAPYMLQKAMRLATSGPSGPVHLNLPADVMRRPASSFARPFCTLFEGGVFNRQGVTVVAEKLVEARKPVIMAGWGVVLSNGAGALLELAELLNIPVTTTPKAKGVFPESHPLSLGVTGFAGSPVAKEYLLDGEVDVLLAVGTSFNEMATNGWDKRLNPTDMLIQIDIDTEQIDKIYETALCLIGDAATVLNEICFAVRRQCEAGVELKHLRGEKPFNQEIERLREKHHEDDAAPAMAGDLYDPKQLVRDIQKSFPDNTVYFADMGNNMAWTIRYMTIDKPYTFYTSMGFASMGYAVAAPIGAKLAVPDQPVVSISGDGSFLMNGFEVATAVNYDIPVIWIIFNNAMLGMVYHGRKLFDKPVPEGIPSTFRQVDFAKVAEGLGARGITIRHPSEFTPELVRDVLKAGRPTVLDVWIDPERVPPIHDRIKNVTKLFN